ncbi:hypothetical protein ASPCAL12366 [Aspergillus calidoustus]|uniref:Uncharacterized protein n=1 Tax=Aspergillus calidoustus TaxID=454130 RepID=A0A0U5GBZ5_ASPCI|nr:hypothetical protein ASPCAL12366 [Aspergillus calidoustus]
MFLHYEYCLIAIKQVSKKMNLKSILLLGSLAFMVHATPTTNYQPIPNMRSDANSLSDGTASLTARGGYGVWLDVYHSADCNSGYNA